MIGILGDSTVRPLFSRLNTEKETLILTGKKTTRVLSGYAGDVSFSYAAPFREEKEISAIREVEALARRGCDVFISFSLGSIINDRLNVGNFYFPADYFDLNSGNWTMQGLPGIVSMKEPFCHNLKDTLMDSVHKFDGGFAEDGTVVSLEGPFGITKAEEKFVNALKVDAISRNVGVYSKVASAFGICHQPIVLLSRVEGSLDEKHKVENAMHEGLAAPVDRWVRPRMANAVMSVLRSFPAEYECLKHEVHPKWINPE